MIEFRALTKAYPGRGDPALQQVSLEVRKGEVLGLVGLNGAGKTTMIRVGAGLLLPTSGTVLLGGRDIVREKVVASSSVGWVPEFPNYDPGARALSLLQYLGGYNGLSGPTAEARCLSLLEGVGLKGKEMQRLGSFSQGMKKRFALATALLAKPENYLLDELLNGLDPEGIRYVRALIAGLRAEGASILLSSHILSEVGNIADRVAILHEGRLLKVVTMDEISGTSERRLRVSFRERTTEAIEYLSKIGQVRQEGEHVLVENPSAEPWEINSELVRLGCQVSELKTERDDLESYFFRTIRGGV
jgi:ABC-2 type transport system ATP-binding protein